MDDRTTDEFDIRFYRWALEDADREMRAGFPLLSTIKGSAALGAKDHFESLPERRRRRLLVALVKRVHPRAVVLTGEDLTEAEENAVRQYLTNRMKFVAKYMNQHNVLEAKLKAIDKKKLAGLIKEKTRPICGNVAVRYSGYHWAQRTLCAEWHVDTYVEVRSSSSFRIKLYQEIVSPADDMVRLKHNISFLLWLGIFPTEWDLLLRGDEEGAANSLQQVCSHFMQAAPQLLAGLHP